MLDLVYDDAIRAKGSTSVIIDATLVYHSKDREELGERQEMRCR